MKAKPKKSWSICHVRGTICDIHFSIGGNIIPTVREQPGKSLGRLYAFSLMERHRGVKVQKTALEGLHIIEKSELTGKVKAWCFQDGLLPSLLWPLQNKGISLTWVETIQQHINKYLRKWLGVPSTSEQLASIPPQLECASSSSHPSQKNSRLENLDSTWCPRIYQMTSYGKYSLKSELETSG